MSWDSPFIVYRLSADGKLEEVFHAKDLKKAKYWLTYIAEPGDVLCRTPAHARHSEKEPTYWSHKIKSGSAITNKAEWEELANEKNSNWTFPSEQTANSPD